MVPPTADSWIDHGIQDVDNHIGEDERHSSDERHPHDDR